MVGKYVPDLLLGPDLGVADDVGGFAGGEAPGIDYRRDQQVSPGGRNSHHYGDHAFGFEHVAVGYYGPVDPIEVIAVDVDVLGGDVGAAAGYLVVEEL